MSVAGKPQSAADAAPRIVEDATCTFCGCVCDDIDLTVESGRIVAARRACPLGESWFFDQPADDGPPCLIDGQPSSVSDGVERAAQILTSARYPLVYGLRDTSCETQQVAAAIADWIGGTIDTPTSLERGPAGVAFQGVGEVTCSLGEIANRGDLVIVWGTDPARDYPRHFSKYSLQPQGMFVPLGRQDRTCVVIDVRPTASAEEADLFLQIEPDKDFEALWVLRALARGVELDAAAIERETLVPLAAWQDLIERMKQASFGVMLFGGGLTTSRGRFINSEALWALVRDMNAFTRFVALPMRGRGNVTGADNVICWRTGFPFGVNLSRGYPRFNPGEYTATEMLERGEVDAALVVASDPLRRIERGGPSAAGRDSAGGHRFARYPHDARCRRRLHDRNLRHPHARHRLPDGRSAAPLAAGLQLATRVRF